MAEGGAPPQKRARAAATWSEAAPAVLEGRAVVKLFCRELKPNFSMPWTTKRQQSSTSTAFVLDLQARLLLTNRHCVAHASCVEVRKRGDDRKYEASIVARGIDCDLALVTVPDEAFWAAGLDEQRLSGETPSLFTEVVCVGYPTGGDNLCVTKGVVSRVDYEDNKDPWQNRLVIQIDAAVNPGNSGGPALLVDGSCIGVAYQSLKDGDTENIGYIVPVAVVQKFLAAWRGRPCGGEPPVRVAAFGHGRFSAQKLENPGMRRALGMREDQSGVLVKSVDVATPNAKVLRQGDIILALDGVIVGNDGCVPFESGPTRHDRVPFPFLGARKFVGDRLEARILRDGSEITCALELCAADALVPSEKEDPQILSYTIVGGLVFVVLSEPYLRETFGEKWRKELCNGLGEMLQSAQREVSDEQVVILSYVLAHRVNLGFQEIRNRRLHSFVVDGAPVRVRNLRHLVELVRASREEFLRFELCSRGPGLHVEVVVLEREAAAAAEPDILRENRIPVPTRVVS